MSLYQVFIQHLEGRLSAAQRRHLRAVETLARVRRLLSRIPAVQLNIATQGGQPVNVVGEVEGKEGLSGRIKCGKGLGFHK